MFGLGYISEELILITIKDKWLPCVPILQLLCISGAFVPINDLHKQLIISKGKSNIYLWNTVIMSIALLIGAIATYNYGIISMVTIYVILSINWLFIWFYFVRKEIDITFIGLAKNILPYALTTIITISISWYITKGINNMYLLLIAKIMTVALIYIGTLWIFNCNILKETIQYALQKWNKS